MGRMPCCEAHPCEEGGERVISRHLDPVASWSVPLGRSILTVSYYLGRETFLLKVKWENDWPIFNQGQKLQLSFESHQEPAPRTTDWQDGFQSPTLSPGWYTKSRLSQSCLLDIC